MISILQPNERNWFLLFLKNCIINCFNMYNLEKKFNYIYVINLRAESTLGWEFIQEPGFLQVTIQSLSSDGRLCGLSSGRILPSLMQANATESQQVKFRRQVSTHPYQIQTSQCCVHDAGRRGRCFNLTHYIALQCFYFATNIYHLHFSCHNFVKCTCTTVLYFKDFEIRFDVGSQ